MAELQAEAIAVAPASSPLLTRLTVSDKSGGKCSLYRNQRGEGGGGVRSACTWGKENTILAQHTVDGKLQQCLFTESHVGLKLH